MLDVVTKDTTNYSAVIRIVDSTDGTPETGVVFNTAGIDLWYRRPASAHTSITEVTQTEGGAHTDGGFVHISDGYYRLDLPDAAVATGAGFVDIGGTVTGMVVIGGRIRLTDVDLGDAVRGGMTALPDANADAAGGLPISDAGGLDLDGNVNAGLVALGLDHLVSAAVIGTDVADNSIIAQLVDDAATADWDNYDNTANSLQALRVRGDAAWTTGGGGSLTQSISWKPIGILQGSGAIDLANTKTWRGGLAITNALDDLPTTVEITPGTYSIDRAAQGGTSWASIVSDAGMSEAAGLVYFDEVFDTATTYAVGDVLRITLKSVSVAADANTYEIADATGLIFYAGIIADTPDVNIARIGGSATNVAAMDLFFSALEAGTGKIDSGTLANDTITALAIQDGAFTGGKQGGGWVTNIQSGLATAAALATVDGVADAILVDTGTTLPASLATLQADTDDIQSRLPASLNNGVMASDIQRINDVALIGDGSATPFTV